MTELYNMTDLSSLRTVCVITLLTETIPFWSSWRYPIWHATCECNCHHIECHLVSWLPQVLLLHCVSLNPRWLHQCHPTCPRVTPPTLWPSSNLGPLKGLGLGCRLWGGEAEQMYRGQRSRVNFQLQLRMSNKFKLLWLYEKLLNTALLHIQSWNVT